MVATMAAALSAVVAMAAMVVATLVTEALAVQVPAAQNAMLVA